MDESQFCAFNWSSDPAAAGTAILPILRGIFFKYVKRKIFSGVFRILPFLAVFKVL